MKPAIIEKKQKNTVKSKAYIRYEKLISDIEKKQQFIADLEEGLDKASSKINTGLLPLIQETQLLSRALIIRLDELATEIGLGKFNREWFEDFICDELDLLLDHFGHQDKILSDLYKKYTDLTPGNIINDKDFQAVINSLSKTFGFEIDAEEFIEKGEQGYFEAHKEKINERLKDAGHFEEAGTEGAQTGNAKQKSKGLDKEAKSLANDARSIYLRLVKKFHPDLETDPLISSQNSEIIKQVTKAYQENDFFSLLKLQITYIDDNEKEAELIADDLIKRYSKILQKQLNDLNTWINQIHFSGKTIIADFIDKNGKFSHQKFAARRREIDRENLRLKSSVADSKKRPKGWFKEQITIIKNSAQQAMIKDMMDNMFSGMRF